MARERDRLRARESVAIEMMNARTAAVRERVAETTGYWEEDVEEAYGIDRERDTNHDNDNDNDSDSYHEFNDWDSDGERERDTERDTEAEGERESNDTTSNTSEYHTNRGDIWYEADDVIEDDNDDNDIHHHHYDNDTAEERIQTQTQVLPSLVPTTGKT